jgi:predicted MFS family arabinose efflux permease
LRKGIFWLLAISFALIALDHNVLLTHLLPLLDEQDIAPGVAVLAASLIGPMQVFGRVGMVTFERRIKPINIFVTCFVLMAIAALALSALSITPLLLALFVLFQGAGYGVTSIMRPVITADFLGRKEFGVVSGLLAIPFLLTAASAPTIAALVWEIGGYDLVIIVALLASIVGLISLLQALRVSKKSPHY